MTFKNTDDLNICNDYIVFGASGMGSEPFVCGRLLVVLQFQVQPIPKGGEDYSLSTGIALASCLSKVIELCILGQHLLSSQPQFGFKPGLSTTICTGILKAVVSQYLQEGSIV